MQIIRNVFIPWIGWNPIIPVPSDCISALIRGGRSCNVDRTDSSNSGGYAEASGRSSGGTHENTTLVKVPVVTATNAPLLSTMRWRE